MAKSTEITEYKPRLPYHPALKEKIGIGPGEWNVLVDTVFPSAKTAGAVALAVSYCKARKLDIFKRVVHIVPIWDKERGCMVETVWPGIAEHRTTASRTREYAGHDECVFGPDVQQTFADGDRDITVTFPAWAQMTVYRLVQGQRCPFPGPKVRWLETYASKKNDAPNSMWADRPYGMIEKCAEAAALRSAFPEELGDEPSEVEASGRNWHGRPAVDVNPITTATISRADAVVHQQTPREIEHQIQNEPGTPPDPTDDEGSSLPIPQDETQSTDTSEAAEKPLTDRQKKYRAEKARTEAAGEGQEEDKPQQPDVTDEEILDGWKFRMEAVETLAEVIKIRKEELPQVPERLKTRVRNIIVSKQNELDVP